MDFIDKPYVYEKNGFTENQMHFVKRNRKAGMSWGDISKHFIYDDGRNVPESTIKSRYRRSLLIPDSDTIDRSSDSIVEKVVNKLKSEKYSIPRMEAINDTVTYILSDSDGVVKNVTYSKNITDIVNPVFKSPVVGKVLSLFDLHFPNHVPWFSDLIPKIIKDFKPDVIVLGGDMLDMEAFSFWAKDKTGLIRASMSPKDMYQGFDQEVTTLIRRAAGPNTFIVYIEGNHEYRAIAAIEEDYRGKGYWELENNLSENVVDLIIPYVSENATNLFRVGDLHFMHGYGRYQKFHSDKIANRYGVPIRYGHFHETQKYTKERTPTSPYVVTAECVPCLSLLNPSYLRGQPSRYVHGLQYGYVEPDGTFFDDVVIINNGRVRIDGVLYKI